MYPTTAAPDAVEGRRRRAVEEDANVTEAVRQARAMADPQPATGPIADALAYARDRLDLVEHKLGDLNGVLEALGYELRPVLTMDGDTLDEPDRETRPEDPEAVDRRSTVARRITALGTRADELASIVGYLRDKAAGIRDALELEGVTR